jgi:uncharacterized membrane protein YedE/YeeE
METTPEQLAPTVAWLGFALAFVFGAVAQRVNFCTMGAVSDVVNMGDWRRMRMWLLAIAVAILAANGLHAAGLIDLGKTIYTTPRVIWLSNIVGGVLFGIGMTLGSGCGSKTLLRIGGGNLKSLIVLIVLAISAYMTLKGLFAVWRVATLDAVSVTLKTPQDLPTLVGSAAGLAPVAARLWVAGIVGAALLAFVFVSRDFRGSLEMVLGGLIIGVMVAGGWYVTGHIGYLSEDPNTLQEAFVATNSGRAESYNLIGPSAFLLELLMFWSDTSKIVTFGIAGVLGMFAGSAFTSVATRTFRWEGFASVEDLVNHIVGGVLMGFGGVTALGCTIGQGISGFSTLAVGSILTFVAIVAGAVVAMKYQMWRLERMA